MNVSFSMPSHAMARPGHHHGHGHENRVSGSQIGEKLVAKFDKDGDGGISADELKGTRMGRRMSVDTFSRIDGDGDGKLTAGEIDTAVQDAGLPGRRVGWARHNHHFHNHQGDTSEAVSQLADLQAKTGTTETTTTLVAFEQTTTGDGGETTTRFVAYQSSTSTTAGAAAGAAEVEGEAVEVPAEQIAAPAAAQAEQPASTAEQPAASSEVIEMAKEIDAAAAPDNAVELAEEVAAEAAAEAAAAAEPELTPAQARVAEVLEQALAEGMTKEDLIDLVEDVVSGTGGGEVDAASEDVAEAVEAVAAEAPSTTTTNVLALYAYSQTVTSAAA